jgi:hypothetical protein
MEIFTRGNIKDTPEIFGWNESIIAGSRTEHHLILRNEERDAIKHDLVGVDFHDNLARAPHSTDDSIRG